MTAVQFVVGASFEGDNLGNVFGLPSLPAGVQFAHLLRSGKDYSGRNIGKLVPGQTGAALTEALTSTLTYEPTDVIVAANDKGWSSPYLVPTSFTWLYVMRAQNNAAFAFSNARASGAPLSDGAHGFHMYSVTDAGFGYFRAAHWDGVSGSSTIITCERSGLFSPLYSGEWSLGVVRYNEATKEMAAFRCYDKQVSKVVLPAGRVIDRRGWSGSPLRIGGSLGQSNSTLRTHKAAFAMGWSAALSDGEVFEVVYPRIKAFLATREIMVS